jgi:hypothetical protein
MSEVKGLLFFDASLLSHNISNLYGCYICFGRLELEFGRVSNRLVLMNIMPVSPVFV